MSSKRKLFKLALDVAARNKNNNKLKVTVA